MNRRVFILLVVLMSVSLLGITVVQVYWIKEAIANKRLKFKNDVTFAMARTSERIRKKEEAEDLVTYKEFFKNDMFRQKAEIKTFLYQQTDKTGKQKFSFSSSFLEEDFMLPLDFVNNDSVVIKRITGKDDVFHSKIIKPKTEGFKEVLDESKFTIYNQYESINRELFSEFVTKKRKYIPIHKRIANRELNRYLKEELAKLNIKQNFKYGVYEDGLATSLKSGYYTIDKNNSYFYPLLEDESGNSKYKLYLSFPNEQKNLYSELARVLFLSILFIIIIITGFTLSMYQLVKQKKISEIKTDFINNMTHEFKTPIATINLALDAIKNPKVINEKEKIHRYIKMIRDENKRMHGQVENVLRMSRLEKNQIDLSKNTINMHEVIEEAIEHISLLIQSKEGVVTTHFKAISSEILGNYFHLTNTVVNILENAIKYSENAPKINVFTENTNKYFTLKIKDEGIGMSKNVQKQIFEKFYREHKGNVHNVKGHGLGLAYVKEIIEKHQGNIYVESEKGKGSTFIIKLALI